MLGTCRDGERYLLDDFLFSFFYIYVGLGFGEERGCVLMQRLTSILLSFHIL